MIMTTLKEWLVEVPVQRERPHRPGGAQEGAAQGGAPTEDGAADDPAELHRARKAIKRLRYAGELLTGQVPQAKKIAKRRRSIQTVLGDHQDLVVAADFLQRVGAQTGVRPGHNGYTYGLLTARVEEQAARIRASLCTCRRLQNSRAIARELTSRVSGVVGVAPGLGPALALVHGQHPGDRDVVALGDQVGGQRLRARASARPTGRRRRAGPARSAW